MRSAAVVFVLLTGCVAAQEPSPAGSSSTTSTTTSGSGGGDGGEGGLGGGGSSVPNGGGGEGGDAGDFGDEEVETGVDKTTMLGYRAVELACHGETLYWFNEETRKVMRLDGQEEEAFAVEGDGEVTIRPADTGVMVSLLGEDGAVWIVDDSGAEVVHEGRVEYAAFGNGAAHWYDGANINNSDGVAAEPEANVAAFALYDEGPVYLTEGNIVFMVKRGETTRVGAVPDDYYADTFTTAGAVAAWGSPSGLRTLLLSGNSLFTFGADAKAVSRGPSGLYLCESTDDGARVSYLELTGKLDTLAHHSTCVSLAACDDRVYWSTARGNVLSVAIGDNVSN